MNKLHLSHEAQADLDDIKAYIEAELGNPIAALSTVGKITRDMRLLSNQAMMGTPLSSVAEVDSDYRFLVSGNYLTFYRVHGGDVYIDRILYGRSDYLRALLGEAFDETEEE